MQKPPRIWISNAAPKAGDIVRVRAQIEHRMESGLRLDAKGQPIARNIVTRFEARLDNDLLFIWSPETAIAQNPFLEFTFMARQSGELKMLWRDDQGLTLTANKALQISSTP